MVLRIRIREHERGLHFLHGNFAGPLSPGVHWFPRALINPRAEQVERVSILDPVFKHPMLEMLARHPRLRDELEIIGLAAEQRALVWREGQLLGIFGPGRHAFWKSPARPVIEVFDTSVLRFTHPRLDAILARPLIAAWFEVVEVGPADSALLFVNGRLAERLGEGRHVFWRGGANVKLRSVEGREQVIDVAGQEIMTNDKVTLRVNLVVAYTITNPEASVTRVTDASQALYREAQLALRAAVGTRKLDDLLADKESAGGEVRHALSERAAEYGVTVRSVGLRDIILPGEMKTILNRVIEAQKAAEAELIKRREETAAARSQANTAKLLAENPVLARLKELELLQGVLANTKATFVLGPSDLAQQVRSLVASGPAPDRSADHSA